MMNPSVVKTRPGIRMGLAVVLGMLGAWLMPVRRDGFSAVLSGRPGWPLLRWSIDRRGRDGVPKGRGRVTRRAILVSGVVAGLCCVLLLLGRDNYHVVVENDLYRSGQMSVEQFVVSASRDRWATVINLRSDTNQSWHIAEVAACEAKGIAYIDFPLDGDKAPSLQAMEKLVDVMRTAQRPILVHCAHGADRTGLAAGLYLYAVGQRSASEAKKSLSLKYGHLPFVMKSFDEALEEYCELGVRPVAVEM